MVHIHRQHTHTKVKIITCFKNPVIFMLLLHALLTDYLLLNHTLQNMSHVHCDSVRVLSQGDRANCSVPPVVVVVCVLSLVFPCSPLSLLGHFHCEPGLTVSVGKVSLRRPHQEQRQPPLSDTNVPVLSQEGTVGGNS